MTNDEMADAFGHDIACCATSVAQTIAKGTMPSVRCANKIHKSARWQQAKQLQLIFAKIWRRANESHSFLIRHSSFFSFLIRHSLDAIKKITSRLLFGHRAHRDLRVLRHHVATIS